MVPLHTSPNTPLLAANALRAGARVVDGDESVKVILIGDLRRGKGVRRAGGCVMDLRAREALAGDAAGKRAGGRGANHAARALLEALLRGPGLSARLLGDHLLCGLCVVELHCARWWGVECRGIQAIQFFTGNLGFLGTPQ